MNRKDIHKQAQSLIDFLTLFKLPGLMTRGNDVTSKEADALVKLWDGPRDEYGNILVSSDADPTLVANLTTKGLLKSKLGGLSIGQKRLVEITAKGKDVIKKIVLHNEQSAFEKDKHAETDYKSIRQAIYEDVPSVKSASSRIWRYEWK